MDFVGEDVERFWSKVAVVGEQDCWLWTAGICKGTGYGRFWVDNKTRNAHRVAYLLSFGEIPAGSGYHGMCVCHKCDVRACVNPNHLFLGLSYDNIQDRNSKGRTAKGSGSGRRRHPESYVGCIAGTKHGQAKLNEAQVLEIRRLRGVASHPELAKRFGVSRAAVSLAQSGKTWRHVQ